MSICSLLQNAPDDCGSEKLAEYIRNNDAQLLETGEEVLKKFQVCALLA